ncbi:Holliday junction resolvase RuvX [Candidatus Shapirobacteria bacterium CG10_big_fil_rev_8_21_14_0_10_40_9]|uniref:Putative pre-16S rRNA nuclease n=1 Tax=Candidatus Shapirobacteria bacterium CG10_big_fil_rev_8_21_14_0_10_40_9 TaxID=1974888 RepID=A0A2M8L4H1_9BACT|nr:MAG: Holliday junction resolvase RuvX [Candidatus Shapirobacteria bacterium CG10_big_fil_rev_8_21_14_0_10_40_9]
MKILAVDFGLAKIGLAISEGALAEPLGIIENKNWETGIKRICQEQKIDKIVVGISEGEMAEKQKKFGVELARVVSLPFEFQDETLTTSEAIAKMREIGKRVKDEDAISAALILQEYLNSKNV